VGGADLGDGVLWSGWRVDEWVICEVGLALLFSVQDKQDKRRKGWTVVAYLGNRFLHHIADGHGRASHEA
jgi:hypothetical protein